MYIKETLIKTIQLESGELYAEISGDRVLLARCEPKIEVYEQTMPVTAIVYKGKKYKRLRYSLILCGNSVYTREVDEEYFYNTKGLTLIAEKQRYDGIFERLTFDDLTINDIKSNMDLILDIKPNSEIMKKLV